MITSKNFPDSTRNRAHSHWLLQQQQQQQQQQILLKIGK